MFRLLFLTFFGKARYDEHKVHVHESPANMLAPLVILAVLAVGGGWVAAPRLVGGVDHFEHFLEPVFHPRTGGTVAGFIGWPPEEVARRVEEAKAKAVAAEAAEKEQEQAEHAEQPGLVSSLLGIPVIVALIGLFTAWWFYIKSPETPKNLAKSLNGPYKLLLNKYYVDEIYGFLIVRPLMWISTNVLWHGVDEGAIDGTVNGVATVAIIDQFTRSSRSGA